MVCRRTAYALSPWPCLIALAASVVGGPMGIADEVVVPGAVQDTPSRAQYFSWINNTNEGSTEAQTFANLGFFSWMRDEYGMQLDIYAWDAGNLDGAGGYGSMSSDRFRANYPHGWKPIADRAAAMGCRLGLWGGPDGYGDTPAQAAERRETLVSLCRDLHFMLFKFDGVCGTLRKEKQDDFVATMIGCRASSPDLIVLNHRLNLGKGLPYVTTNLWEGAETYIDVHMANHGTATHHRAGALARGIPDHLNRLLEDHGVCLSSCMDAWDDDLVLQAFNREMIVAPEIYGNPWFLRDDEFPKLARIYNLHRRYRDILVAGMRLPEAGYGPLAIARGDAANRIVTLRNLGWTPVTYQVHLDDGIGLTAEGDVELWRFHPHERLLGRFHHGDAVAIEVPPFRSCLLMATTKPSAELGVSGCDCEVVHDVPGRPLTLTLLGMPGTTAQVTVHPGRFTVSSASLDGMPPAALAAGVPIAVTFPGTALTLPWHRKLGDLVACDVPADAEGLFEATCFATDSDALEVRSLRRAGVTHVPAVQHARDAFTEQSLLRTRGCWDRVLFDGDPATALAVAADRFRGGATLDPGVVRQLRIDLASVQRIDSLTIHSAGGENTGPVECSSDLLHWAAATVMRTDQALVIAPVPGEPIRYLRLDRGTLQPTEIDAIADGKPVPRQGWRASNLNAAYRTRPAEHAWQASVRIDEAAPGSYLCIALDGEHGVDGAWVAARLTGRLIGCPDRAPSFNSNVWEHDGALRHAGRDYTYYLPVTPDMIGMTVDVVALTLHGGVNTYHPSVWITTANPLISRELALQ
jgi:hypothetical protein